MKYYRAKATRTTKLTSAGITKEQLERWIDRYFPEEKESADDRKVCLWARYNHREDETLRGWNVETGLTLRDLDSVLDEGEHPVRLGEGIIRTVTDNEKKTGRLAQKEVN